MSSPRFYVAESFAGSASVVVGEDAARHMRVLRLAPGAEVTLLDGQGTRAAGRLRILGKRSATVDLEHVDEVQPLPVVHLLIPIADRDRMLWLAEKAAEFGVASWRPMMWKRSRSVSPKGEGSVFQGKVRARMVAALEQSGNAWLPMIYPDATIEHALAAVPPGPRIVLDAGGENISRVIGAHAAPPLTIAVGPEGGLDETELQALVDAGFSRASLGPMILRFETAGVAALAHARAALHAQPAPSGTEPGQ